MVGNFFGIQIFMDFIELPYPQNITEIIGITKWLEYVYHKI